MKTVDTHGIKINGLRKASGYTENFGFNSHKYVEIFFDRSNGDVWGVFQFSVGENNWTEYHDPNVIKICNTSCHLTMQQIADEIWSKLDELDRHSSEL